MEAEVWQWVMGEVDETQCPWVAETRSVVEARVTETVTNGFNWEWVGLRADPPQTNITMEDHNG